MLFLASIYQWYFDYQIKYSTFWIFLGAGIVFITTEYTYRICRHSLHRQTDLSAFSFSASDEIRQPIVISKSAQYSLLIFVLLVVVASYYRIILCTSSGTWGERVRQYEILVRGQNYNSPAPLLDYFVGQATRITKAIVYVIVYMIIYNKIYCGVGIKRQKMLAVILALFVPMTLFQGVRQPAVELVVFCLLIHVILKRVSGKRLKIIKLALISMILVAIFIPLFSSATSIVGGLNIKRDAIKYVATYLCGGLKNFDELIVGNPYSTKYFGQSTFSSIYSFLINKFQILPRTEDLSYHAIGFFGDTSITTFGRWYEDFGSAGVIVMTMVVSLFFAWLYDKSLTHAAPNLAHIIYAQQAMALVWASYDDRVSPLISFSNIIFLVLLTIVYRIIMGGGKYRVVFRGKKIRFRLENKQS